MKKENDRRNSKVKDSSSKIIFAAPILCAQFLRNYTGIPLLQNVQPEDIEDVSERFVHMFTEERNSDVVKRVRMKDDETAFYLISLIEHKSDVDYNVVMQVFRYMAFIWEDYEKEAERQQAYEEGIKKLIQVCRNLGITKEVLKKQLMEEYAISAAEADGKIEKYW